MVYDNHLTVLLRMYSTYPFCLFETFHAQLQCCSIHFQLVCGAEVSLTPHVLSLSFHGTPTILGSQPENTWPITIQSMGGFQNQALVYVNRMHSYNYHINWTKYNAYNCTYLKHTLYTYLRIHLNKFVDHYWSAIFLCITCTQQLFVAFSLSYGKRQLFLSQLYTSYLNHFIHTSLPQSFIHEFLSQLLI